MTSTSMQTAECTLLWVDLRLSKERPSLLSEIRHKYTAVEVFSPQSIYEVISRVQPRVACFEFDHPIATRLKLLQEGLIRFASLPVLMVTENHSENLAVWAFRSGVRDYVVTPVNLVDFCEHLDYLLKSGERGSEGQIRRRVTPLPSEIMGAPMSEPRRRTSHAINFIQENLNKRITLKEVAQLCHMSQSEFSRSFTKEHGVCFREYVAAARVRKARELLASGVVRISDVAWAVGFTDLSYFDRVFKRRLGICPTGLRTE